MMCGILYHRSIRKDSFVELRLVIAPCNIIGEIDTYTTETNPYTCGETFESAYRLIVCFIRTLLIASPSS